VRNAAEYLHSREITVVHTHISSPEHAVDFYTIHGCQRNGIPLQLGYAASFSAHNYPIRTLVS